VIVAVPVAVGVPVIVTVPMVVGMPVIVTVPMVVGLPVIVTVRGSVALSVFLVVCVRSDWLALTPHRRASLRIGCAFIDGREEDRWRS
jgi:hypothetical protein